MENTLIPEEKTQIQQLWERICEKLENVMNPFSFEHTMRGIQALKIINRQLVLQAQTELAANALLGHNAELIKETVVACGVSFGLIGFKVFVEGSDLYSLKDIEESSPYPITPINKNFTFQSFVAGPESKLVYEAAKTVAENSQK